MRLVLLFAVLISVGCASSAPSEPIDLSVPACEGSAGREPVIISDESSPPPGLTPPRLLSMDRSARWMEEELQRGGRIVPGEVVIHILVDEHGTNVAQRIVSNSGSSSLGDAAVRVARRHEYTSARIGGCGVPAIVIFRLNLRG